MPAALCCVLADGSAHRRTRHGDGVDTGDARTESFIERMGLMTEADGLPRIAGRIFAYLLLTPGECSLEDLAAALGVSRASVSNDARRLARMGLLERRSRPGDRRDYYLIAPDGFRRSIEDRIDVLRRFQALLEEARSLPAAADDVVQARVAAWDDAHRVMVETLQRLLATVDARPLDDAAKEG